MAGKGAAPAAAGANPAKDMLNIFKGGDTGIGMAKSLGPESLEGKAVMSKIEDVLDPSKAEPGWAKQIDNSHSHDGANASPVDYAKRPGPTLGASPSFGTPPVAQNSGGK